MNADSRAAGQAFYASWFRSEKIHSKNETGGFTGNGKIPTNAQIEGTGIPAVTRLPGP
jgi:hypothetical protein